MLKELATNGIKAALGAPLVKKALNKLSFEGPVHVLAVGKAASSMMTGAQQSTVHISSGFMVTKVDHLEDFILDDLIHVYEAGHPIPNNTSLVAGTHMLEWVSSLSPSANLIVLLSGGASTLVEVLPEGWTLKDLQILNRQLLASGADIESINRNRKCISLIKGGKLLQNFNGRRVEVFSISDVQGDKLESIGSGLGIETTGQRFQHNSTVIASNQTVRKSIEQSASFQGLPVRINEESLYEDVATLCARLVQQVNEGRDGLYIYGGESTVKLPPSPGIGGRNQMLALLFARELKKSDLRNISGVFLGTDGTDGPTKYAGASVDWNTLENSFEADRAIEAADPTPFLEQKQACINTGPTGTNVMDIALIRKN
jgi:hydroxypyruvate reductase